MAGFNWNEQKIVEKMKVCTLVAIFMQITGYFFNLYNSVNTKRRGGEGHVLLLNVVGGDTSNSNENDKPNGSNDSNAPSYIEEVSLKEKCRTGLWHFNFSVRWKRWYIFTLNWLMPWTLALMFLRWYVTHQIFCRTSESCLPIEVRKQGHIHLSTSPPGDL